MVALRLLVVAGLLLALTVLTALAPQGRGFSGGPAVSAALGESQVFRSHNDNNGNGNRNDNNDNNFNFNDNNDNNGNDNNRNGNDNNGNDNNGNDNNGNGNGNDNNGNGNDNNGNGNDNHHRVSHPSPPTPPRVPDVVSHCYGAGEVGAVSLTLPGGSVTLDVVPASSFPKVTGVSLTKVDPSSAPGTPGARLDDVVFDLKAQDNCSGGALSELPADVNLGLAYSVAANKSALRFAAWDGSRWVDVPTVPDPSATNPYISATIRRTGTYTVYQAP